MINNGSEELEQSFAAFVPDHGERHALLGVRVLSHGQAAGAA